MYEKYFVNAFIWTAGADEAIFFRASSATPAHSSVALAEPNQTDALECWVLNLNLQRPWLPMFMVKSAKEKHHARKQTGHQIF